MLFVFRFILPIRNKLQLETESRLKIYSSLINQSEVWSSKLNFHRLKVQEKEICNMHENLSPTRYIQHARIKNN